MSLNSAIQKVGQTHQIDAAAFEEIRNAVLNPKDQKDTVSPAEKNLLVALEKKIEDGTIAVVENDSDDRDLAFELRSLAATDVFVGIAAPMQMKANTMMVDLKGVTIIAPYASGNANRHFISFQGIESATVDQSFMSNHISIKTSGIHTQGEEVYFPNGRLPEANALINTINDRVTRAAQGQASKKTRPEPKVSENAQAALFDRIQALATEAFDQLARINENNYEAKAFGPEYAAFDLRRKRIQALTNSFSSAGGSEAKVEELRNLYDQFIVQAANTRIGKRPLYRIEETE